MALILTERNLEGHGPAVAAQTYNALDCIMTWRAHTALAPLIPNAAHLALQHAEHVPALAMTLRGIRVDPVALREAILAQTRAEGMASLTAGQLASRWWRGAPRHVSNPCLPPHGNRHQWGSAKTPLAQRECRRCGQRWLTPTPLNLNSSAQLVELLYGQMGLPAQHSHKTHELSVDRECLEKLRDKPEAAYALPLIDAIREARIARKQLGALQTELGPTGRWHASQHVSMTVTGRWSSSGSPFWHGANIQNIADRSRTIFVPDPGLVLGYADYEKAESHIVAYDAEDENYIEAHRAGDVHTYVARLVWPSLGKWSTGSPTDCGGPHLANGSCCDRGLASLPTPWNPHLTYRDFAKHVAHGASIGMTKYGIARDARITQKAAQATLDAFFAAFPRIRIRQQEIWETISRTGRLETPFGRVRRFTGRLVGDSADSTRREALAQTQQSMVADWLGIAICRLWRLDGSVSRVGGPRPSGPNRIWLLAQIHDAILAEVRWGDDAALAAIREAMTLSLDIRGRRLTIPVEIAVGPSWAHRDLRTWRPGFKWPEEWR